MADPEGLVPNAAWEYRPRRPARFEPGRIVLAKGSLATRRRREMVQAVCGLYPKAQVLELLDRPHNRVDVGPAGPQRSRCRGDYTRLPSANTRAGKSAGIGRAGRLRSCAPKTNLWCAKVREPRRVQPLTPRRVIRVFDSP